MIERVYTAERINEILNHPAVYPWVKGPHEGPFDMTDFLKKEGCLGFVGEFGCFIGTSLQFGIYEFHTAVLPEGQGSWATQFFRSGLDWMFTKTNTVELLTKCPHDNPASKMGARRVGFDFMFSTRPVWPSGTNMVPVDVYGMTLQKWATLSQTLVEKGQWFHAELERQYRALEKDLVIHDEDSNHDRYVGGAVSMIEAGFPLKGVSFYNRWAMMSAYKPISVVSSNPLVIDIRESRLQVVNNKFEVL